MFSVFEMKSDDARLTLYFLGVKFLSISKFKIMSKIDSIRVKGAIKDFANDVCPILIWFDHCLGGGTEIYSQRELEKKKLMFNIIRVRSNKKGEFYVTFIRKNKDKKFWINGLDRISDFIGLFNVREIVINSLVDYRDVSQILNIVKGCKRVNVKITLNVHDYFCICPRMHFLDLNEEYCALDFDKCEACTKCFAKMNPLIWREMWGSFICYCCDEVRVFSRSSSEILRQVFPEAESNLSICPHVVPRLRLASIPKHEGINIAILGNVGSVHKGKEVVIDLAKYVERVEDVKLYNIGEFGKYCSNQIANMITVTGKYDVYELPEICERLQIDMILIPSICPETFSYTTSEAIMMKIPVAVFNLGAQAEKVQQYEKGLVLTSMAPENIIFRIRQYLSHFA